MPVKHELTALRTTCLPENCEGTEGRCSVTRHLILHFHKKTKQKKKQNLQTFVAFLALVSEIFNDAKCVKWNI